MRQAARFTRQYCIYCCSVALCSFAVYNWAVFQQHKAIFAYRSPSGNVQPAAVVYWLVDGNWELGIDPLQARILSHQKTTSPGASRQRCSRAYGLLAGSSKAVSALLLVPGLVGSQAPRPSQVHRRQLRNNARRPRDARAVFAVCDPAERCAGDVLYLRCSRVSALFIQPHALCQAPSVSDVFKKPKTSSPSLSSASLC